jgi:hypothetical protein
MIGCCHVAASNNNDPRHSWRQGIEGACAATLSLHESSLWNAQLTEHFSSGVHSSESLSHLDCPAHLQLMGPPLCTVGHAAEQGVRQVDVVPLVVDEPLTKGPLAGSAAL